MEIFLLILFWISIWVCIGVFTAFLKMFVFFRGPTHMIQMYLLHPKTQKQMVVLCQLAQKRSNNIIVYIMMVQYVFAGIFMPLAVVELIMDVILFTNFIPPKKDETQNEQ